MSFQLTCDSCGLKISLEDLKEGRALQHEDSHYCERCKAPILAFLKKSGKSLQTGPETDRPKAEVPKPPKEIDPLSALEELDEFKDSGADLEAEISAALPPPPSPLPPKKPATKQSPATGPASPGKVPPAPASGGSAKPPKGPGKPPRLTGADGESKQPAHPRPISVGRPSTVGGRPGRPRGIPSRLQIRIGSKVRPVQPPSEKEAVLGPDETDRESATTLRRKRVLIFGGIGAGVAVLALILSIIFKGDTTTTELTSTSSVPGVTDHQGIPALPQSPTSQELKMRVLELEKKRALEEFRKGLSDDPEDLLSLKADLEAFVPIQGIQREYVNLLKETEKRLREAEERFFQNTLKENKEYQEKENFQAAAVLWEMLPEIISQNPNLRRRWMEEREKAARYGEAWALWTKINNKVAKYLHQKDLEIAIAILECQENYPKGFHLRYPLIWKKREERLDGLRTNYQEELAKIDRENLEKAFAQAEARRLQAEKEREERWAERLLTTPWVPLISEDGNDLENWTVRSIIWNPKDIFNSKVPWTIQMVDGKPAITAPKQDQDIEIGMNGNRWLDWVLEFDIKVETGILRLRTRTMIAGAVFRTRVTQESQSYEFPAEDYGSWTRLRLEIRGSKVILLRGGEVLMEAKTSSAHQEGGFIFVLTANSLAMIRDVQLKLVHDTRRPRDEEFEEEEEEDY